MGAGQSDLYKGTYGDNIDNIPEELREESKESSTVLTESAVRERYICNLSRMSPDEVFRKLREDGYEVRPLSRGRYKGIPFNEGGGFKTNIGKDGVFQYHPSGSHHNEGGPYYKLATGYSGTIRYDVNGGILNE